MNVLLVDGHPDEGRFASHLLDIYENSLPASCTVTRLNIRELEFTPILRRGYLKRTDWEPDILSLAQAFDDCDHAVFAFPMWWGAEPAELKGLLDRLFLPGFMYQFRSGSSLWDRYLEGRSADVIATMDTPPLFLRLLYGNSIIHRWKKQVLGFVGFDPVRFLACGPIKDGGAEKSIGKWTRKIERMAGSIRAKSPNKKQMRLASFLAGATR
ncbi:NAD(P)H-dependent oxidoreductase [uncultured Erythrobacter sp.]|uniref:NAD(P)H-dependent oxidoreductase n=1 Tax=uncultured Erythrobacter sp. TaxID=263913 RepID=UPI002639357B|nr:NAD(P)H-dependent oxidoreductase [uncultured Erythrobacter sp.]